MKPTYIETDFRETVSRLFPERAEALTSAFTARLHALLGESADESKEKKRHLRNQILPGIAAYETLQTVMTREEALSTIHGYVERLGEKYHKYLTAILRLPGLYRVIPGVFVKSTRSAFGPAAGFALTELKTDKNTWRIDMTKCPYNDTCIKYGCPELCRCFCDSDDITYGNLHPGLVWHRTKTLGRGDERCDFCMKLVEKK